MARYRVRAFSLPNMIGNKQSASITVKVFFSKKRTVQTLHLRRLKETRFLIAFRENKKKDGTTHDHH